MERKGKGEEKGREEGGMVVSWLLGGGGIYAPDYGDGNDVI